MNDAPVHHVAPTPSDGPSPSASAPEQGGPTTPDFLEKRKKKAAATRAGKQVIKLANGATTTYAELAALSLPDLAKVHWRNEWWKTARENQHPPENNDWTIWGVVSGRGWGKTLTAAQWLAWQCAWKPNTIGHVIAPTLNDTKHVCFEGPTGLLKIIPEQVLKD